MAFHSGLQPPQGRRILFFCVFLFLPFRVMIVGEIALSRGCAIAPPRAVIFSPFQGSNQAIIKLLAMSKMSIYFRMRRPCPPPPLKFMFNIILCTDVKRHPWRSTSWRRHRVGADKC